MNVLTKPGLGKKKLVFSKDDNHQQLVEKINKAYPHLVQCGRFTLYRAATGGYGRPLTSLNTQFHIKLLRRRKVSGHGVIYIKPVQQNLSLDHVTEEEVCYLNILCIFLRRVWPWFITQNLCFFSKTSTPLVIINRPITTPTYNYITESTLDIIIILL